MSPTAVVLALSCIQSRSKKWLTDIMISSLTSVGKCFIGPSAMAGGFVWVCYCLCILQSVFPPILLFIFPPSFCSPFCLFRSVSFLGIYTLFFCDIWHGIRAPCGIVWDFYRKTQFGQKWPKNDQKWYIVINFCIKH